MCVCETECGCVCVLVSVCRQQHQNVGNDQNVDHGCFWRKEKKKNLKKKNIKPLGAIPQCYLMLHTLALHMAVQKTLLLVLMLNVFDVSHTDGAKDSVI